MSNLKEERNALLNVYDKTTPIFAGLTVCRNPAANKPIPKMRTFPKRSSRTASQRWIEMVM